MTLYYSLVFVLLVFEMVLFVALIVPMPFAAKRKLFNFISENPIVAKIQYGMKITFIFILILFLDSVNRVYRVQVEMGALMRDTTGAGPGPQILFPTQYVSDWIHLFLSLILNRTYTMILDVLRLEEKVKMYEGDRHAGGKEGEKLTPEYRADQIAELKKQLNKKDKELEAMKKQAEGLQKEYDSLSVKYNQTNPSTGNKKSN